MGFLTTATTVTPTTTDAAATVTVNGVAVVSGSASAPIPLAVGENTLTVIVTAEDGVSTGTYTVTVTRESANEFAQQAYIKASNPGVGDQFGYSIALSGDTLAVGAYREDSSANGIDGDESDSSLTDEPAPCTCSSATVRCGRNRPISRPPIPTLTITSASVSPCPAIPWPWGPNGKTARQPASTAIRTITA